MWWEQGRELDRLVAEKVMGFKFIGPGLFKDGACVAMLPKNQDDAVPNYSTDISAAWKIIDKLNNDGWEVNMYLWGGSDKEKYGIKSWQVEFMFCPGGFFMGRHTRNDNAAGKPSICDHHHKEMKIGCYGVGDTGPAHAICLAALEAVK